MCGIALSTCKLFSSTKFIVIQFIIISKLLKKRKIRHIYLFLNNHVRYNRSLPPEKLIFTNIFGRFLRVLCTKIIRSVVSYTDDSFLSFRHCLSILWYFPIFFIIISRPLNFKIDSISFVYSRAY